MLLGERNWTEAKDLTERVVVIPLGAFEQHGFHLPLLTDTLIGGEIARRAALELGDEALFLPPLWIGASDHHRAYPGTVSLGYETYTTVIRDLTESLIGSGFRRLFFLNAHGGNMPPAQIALYDLQIKHRDKPDLWLALSSWWTVAAPQIKSLPGLAQTTVNHACELETSMVLCLHPELVDTERAQAAHIPFPSAFYVPDFTRDSRVSIARAFDQLSVSGAFGHPELATAEKGEALYQITVAQVVAFVREFALWQPFAPQ